MFQKIGSLAEIEAEKDYPIPAGATHVGRRTGKIGFFRYLHNPIFGDYRSNKWMLIRIPSGAKTVRLPEFDGVKPSGWQYGNPCWI